MQRPYRPPRGELETMCERISSTVDDSASTDGMRTYRLIDSSVERTFERNEIGNLRESMSRAIPVRAPRVMAALNPCPSMTQPTHFRRSPCDSSIDDDSRRRTSLGGVALGSMTTRKPA